MTDDVIPDHIRQFLVQNFDSVAEWEGLLLLRAHQKNKWDAYRSSKLLYISEDATAALLDALERRGFLKLTRVSGAKLYQYAPRDAELATNVENLADLYRKYLIAVTQIIHAKNRNRVQAFADSFKLRKD